MTTSQGSNAHDVVQALLHEAAAITAAANRLNSASVDKAVEILEQCQSKVIVSGVGKSGLVARKIAATFSSVGLVSLYLNPLDALHGDLGVVAPGDVVILLSNSGETQEIVAMISHLRLRKTKLIAIVGKVDSAIGRGCDVAIDAGVETEAGPHNIVPTSSTTVAMAIGDALATVWMQRRKITPDEFATNHPGGQLGKRLTLFVRDLMIPIDRIAPLPTNAPLVTVVEELTRYGIGTVWVRDAQSKNAIDGLITDGDLRRALRSHEPAKWAALTAGNIMTADPITVDGDTLAFDAMKKMERNNKKAISVLPVADVEGTVIGILRLHDLVQAGLAEQPAEDN